MQNTKKYRKIIFICISIVLVAFIAKTLAKYLIKYQDTAEANATKFYFKSNALDTTEKQYNYYDWDGKSEYNIEFELYNYEDELRYSDFDIQYTVATESNSNDIEITSSITNGTLLNESKPNTNRVKLTIKPKEGIEISDAVNLKVTATSTSPYEKSLTGIFNINVSKTNPYDVNLEAEKDYEKLIITTYSYKGDVKIKYDSTKLMLFTDNIEGITATDDGVTLNVQSNSNYQIEFIRQTKDSIELGKDIIIET